MQYLELWLHASLWLSKDLKNWPKYPLLSLAPEFGSYFTASHNYHDINDDNNKFIKPKVNNNISNGNNKFLSFNNVHSNNHFNHEEIVNIHNYSSFDKVMSITKYLFVLLIIVRKEDPYKMALKYWVKSLQNSCYTTEMEFLKSSPQKSQIPLLVNNLNLFVDSDGILRSRAE